MSLNDNTMFTNKVMSVISGLDDWATWAYSCAGRAQSTLVLRGRRHR